MLPLHLSPNLSNIKIHFIVIRILKKVVLDIKCNKQVFHKKWDYNILLALLHTKPHLSFHWSNIMFP